VVLYRSQMRMLAICEANQALKTGLVIHGPQTLATAQRTLARVKPVTPLALDYLGGDGPPMNRAPQDSQMRVIETGTLPGSGRGGTGGP
jgi:hypothetical protein